MPNLLFSVFSDDRFMDLTIYQYGYEKCRSLHSYGPAVRNHFLFHYIISGKGTLYANDENMSATVYEVSAGTGFLIEPGYVDHYWADRDDPWEYVWVEFGGLRARELMEMAGLSQAHPIYQPQTPEDGRRLMEEMFQIVHGNESGSLFLIGHLYLFMDLLVSTSKSKKQMQRGSLGEFYVREALTYIEQNYVRDISVEDIARICRLDRSYFGKVFKEHVGQSPQEFLMRYRMKKAAETLTITDTPVGAVGISVGYPNAMHFSRAFKGVYGMSPRAYRQKYKLVDSPASKETPE